MKKNVRLQQQINQLSGDVYLKIFMQTIGKFFTLYFIV